MKFNNNTVINVFVVTFILLSFKVSCQNINPQSIVGVECKSGMEDFDIPFYEDMSFGISGDSLVKEFNNMHINTLRISIVRALQQQNRSNVVVNFVRKINESGGGNLKILLDQRKWDLYKATKQDEWSTDIAYIFNALRTAGLDSMVVGCVFDENTPLNDAQSNESLWIDHFNGILGAMDMLNTKTNNAFLNRTVFIHGKGYGSQFKGVKDASDSIDFPDKMKSRCTNYAFDFKYFQTGIPADKSLTGWINHFKNYCCLSEVEDLGIPLVFVGDAGDGLRANSFTDGKNPYGAPGQFVMRALLNVFQQSHWTGMSFGPFIKDVIPDTIGKTILHSVDNGFLIPREDIIKSWMFWYNSTQIVSNIGLKQVNSNCYKFYPNPAKDYIFLENLNSESYDMSIYNLSGKKVFMKKKIDNKLYKVDLSHMLANEYLISLKLNNYKYILKLIKQ